MSDDNLYKNKTYLGILGDPAKIELYDESFYSALKYDDTQVSFNLLGASEKYVNRINYKLMFSKFSHELTGYNFKDNLPFLTNNSTHYSWRIGLFPSGINHLIRGPKFIFSPYPINSTSQYLKLKSKIITNCLKPFVRQKMIPIGYCPLGGKASQRTKAKTNYSNDSLAELFNQARFNNYLKLLYLEAGSGEQPVDKNIIQNIFLNQLAHPDKPTNIQKLQQLYPDADRFILSGFIYGGGITSINDLERIIGINDQFNIIPQYVIIGNISENNIDMTFKLIDKFQELNEIASVLV
ncbi:MAG: hypothetical protein OEZ01_10880 [Candidatus Heimdallarchaeota archaeon]|nr:hypothetical protein [Candidatus Heimdallarchaeota archaeon]MDH5646505.1 hypothetical protein [Candidatus Heimdallarchaeota archaeon]